MDNFTNNDLAKMVYHISKSIGFVNPTNIDRVQLICWFSDVDWSCHTYLSDNSEASLIRKKYKSVSMSGIKSYYWADGMPVSDEVFHALIELALRRKTFNDDELQTFFESVPDFSKNSLKFEILDFWINYSRIRDGFDLKKLLKNYLWHSKVSNGENLPLRYGLLNSNPVEGSQVHKLMANKFSWDK